jgi:hypothetical protein
MNVFGEEYRGCGGIFIVLKNIDSGSSLESLLISFFSSNSRLELSLILLSNICSGSSFKPLLMRILSVAVRGTNRF